MFLNKYNDFTYSRTNKEVLKMFTRTKMITSIALLTGVFYAPVGSANDLELRATTIPASACRPASDNQDALVELKNGAYVFRSGQIGTVNLLCPLPLNGWRVGVSLNQQLFDQEMNMSSYRIFFKDSDPCSMNDGVTARLRYRKSTAGKVNVGTTWSSSTEPNGRFCFFPTGNDVHRSVEVPLDHTLRNGRFYHFLVQIKRDSTTDKPVFTGIDFPFEFIPPS